MPLIPHPWNVPTNLVLQHQLIWLLFLKIITWSSHLSTELSFLSQHMFFSLLSLFSSYLCLLSLRHVETTKGLPSSQFMFHFHPFWISHSLSPSLKPCIWHIIPFTDKILITFSLPNSSDLHHTLHELHKIYTIPSMNPIKSTPNPPWTPSNLHQTLHEPHQIYTKPSMNPIKSTPNPPWAPSNLHQTLHEPHQIYTKPPTNPTKSTPNLHEPHKIYTKPSMNPIKSTPNPPWTP